MVSATTITVYKLKCVYWAEVLGNVVGGRKLHFDTIFRLLTFLSQFEFGQKVKIDKLQKSISSYVRESLKLFAICFSRVELNKNDENL